MDVMVVNTKGPSMDNGLVDNRSKLLRLAETIKPTRRKPPPPRKALSLKEDPSYTNIEHLVFGTYKNRSATSKIATVVDGRTHVANREAEESVAAENSEGVSPTLRPGSETIRNRRSAAVLMKPGCYHSLDRSRLLTSSSSRALPTDTHANITLLHVEYPPPPPPPPPSTNKETATASQLKQKSPVSRNQQKTSVHVTRPPTQRSLSETSEGSVEASRVSSWHKEKNGSNLPRSLAATKKTGSREVDSTKTLITVNATNKISSSGKGSRIHESICSSLVCTTKNACSDEADSSSSSLNTSMLTTTPPTTSATDTTNSSLYLSADSLGDSSEELPTPHPPSPVQPSSSHSRRSVSSILSTQRNRTTNKNPEPSCQQQHPQTSSRRTTSNLQRSSSMVAPNSVKKAQTKNPATRQIKDVTRKSRTSVKEWGAKLEISNSTSSLDSNEGSVPSARAMGRRSSAPKLATTTTTTRPVTSSKIPTNSNNHIRTSTHKQSKEADGPRRAKNPNRQLSATIPAGEGKKPISSQSCIVVRKDKNNREDIPESHPTPDPDAVTCVKTLPQENARTSPERYNLERPNRALYTWYETRRRPSLSAAQQSPWQPEDQHLAKSEWRSSGSLPKSLLGGTREKVAPSSDETKHRRQSVAYEGTSITDGQMKRDKHFEPLIKNMERCAFPKECLKENEASTPSPDTFRQSPDGKAPSVQETDGGISPEGRSKNERLVGTTESPACPHSPTRAPPHNPLLQPREKSMNKAVRRLKASSSPAAFAAGPRGEMSASDGDLRRPWSQIYTEDEAERALASTTCILDGSGGVSCADLRTSPSTIPLSPSSPSGTPTCRGLLPAFTARCSSLRATNHQPIGNATTTTPAESVLQKFRKSFSLRFYRNKRPPSPSSSSTTTTTSSILSISLHSNGVSDRPPTPVPLHAGGSEGSASTFSVTSAAEDEADTVFKFGPLIWRSSKEKRQKNRRGGVNCNSPDSGIQVEGSPRRPQTILPPTPPPSSTPSSPGIIPRRGKSSSLRLDRPHRPLSDVGHDFSSSVLLNDSKLGLEERRVVRRTYSDLSGSQRLTEKSIKSESKRAIPPLMKMKSEKRISATRHLRRRQGKLRRSISQPLEIEKITSMNSLAYLQGLSDAEDNIHESSSMSSDGEVSSDGETTPTESKWNKMEPKNNQYITYAEALWDHVTMDSMELPMKVGDLVAVLECTDRHWWVGQLGDRIGWFPAAFVRPRVNQTDTRDQIAAEIISESKISKLSQERAASLSTHQMRTNVIHEIIATERDFVQHLKDVIEGYLKQMRKRTDMFPEDRINVIFGNIEQIYLFQSTFLAKLEECINWEEPHLSELGACFVDHKGFQIYSDYCNNHPHAVHELQELFMIPKYACFFEACRLLQDMIDISLDGFLLTPIQKICKYPLQLAELLKYTPIEHPDRCHVMEALETMRHVAQYINERKRRMECVEKLAAWQLTVEYWEGPDLLDSSSQLIHSGDVTKLSSSWSRDVTLFLFDHQLIICKKDLIKRNTYCYKSRVNLDESEVLDLPDGRDTQSGMTVKCAWRLYCRKKDKWYTFCTKSPEEKNQWMKAFQEERQKVANDEAQGFTMSEKTKKEATKLANHKLKRSKGKNGKEFSSRRMPPTNVINHQMLKMKSGSLPHGIILNKKKNSGWFTFGSGKKHKR